MPFDVGYLGYSNTWMSVEGYHDLGGERMWPPIVDYGGGTMKRLLQPRFDEYWDLFDVARYTHGDPAIVWLQCGATPPMTDQQAYADAKAVLIKLRLHTTAPIQVSPMHDYAAGYGDNTAVGPTAYAVSRVVSEGLAEAGPILSPLGAGQLMSDKRHPNPAGKLVLGQDLLDWFG